MAFPHALLSTVASFRDGEKVHGGIRNVSGAPEGYDAGAECGAAEGSGGEAL